MARKAESMTFEYDRRLRQFVMGKLAYAGMNKKELAERMGISLAALNYKLKDPNGKLTLAEYRMILRIFKATDEEKRLFA